MNVMYLEPHHEVDITHTPRNSQQSKGGKVGLGSHARSR
jgi:hypothetical protein